MLPSEGPAEKLDQLKLWVKQEGSLTLPLPFLRLLLAKMKIDLDACLPMILCWDVFKKETRNGDDVLRFDLPRAGALLKKKHEKTMKNAVSYFWVTPKTFQHASLQIRSAQVTCQRWTRLDDLSTNAYAMAKIHFSMAPVVILQLSANLMSMFYNISLTI